MTTTVQRWGNSLALRIPKSLAQDARLSKGASVELFYDHGRLIIEPQYNSRHSLASLLKRISKENLHNETDAGKPAGREVW